MERKIQSVTGNFKTVSTIKGYLPLSSWYAILKNLFLFLLTVIQETGDET